LPESAAHRGKTCHGHNLVRKQLKRRRKVKTSVTDGKIRYHESNSLFIAKGPGDQNHTAIRSWIKTGQASVNQKCTWLFALWLKKEKSEDRKVFIYGYARNEGNNWLT